MLLWFSLSFALASDAQILHVSLFEASQISEAQGLYAQAYAQCEDAVAVWPTGPRAQTCDKRLLWMNQRRDKNGGFATLQALQAVRESRDQLAAHEAVERVTTLLSSEGHSPTMRAEVQLWLAHQGLAAGLTPESVLVWTTGAWERREELPQTTRMDVTLTHAKALALAGRLDEASSVENEARVARNTTRNTPVEAVAQIQRRARWAQASLLGLALFVLTAAPSAYRVGAHKLRGALPGLGLIWLSVGSAWALASAWEPRAGVSLPAFGLMASVIHVLARAALRPSTRTKWPIRLGAGLATLCAGYLSLYHFNSIDWVVP